MFLRLFEESLLMYLGLLGCQGQYCEQLRKGNMFPSYTIAGAHLHPGRRANQAKCLPSEACLCSKENFWLFVYESMQEFVICPSVLFVGILHLQFIKEFLAAAFCTVWEQCRDENGLSKCRRFHTNPPTWKTLLLMREQSLTFNKSSAVLTCCLEIRIINKLIMFRNTPVAMLDETLCNAFLPNKLQREGPGGWEVERRSQAQLSYYLSVVLDSSL